jgi:tol-pal system protein YbgF
MLKRFVYLLVALTGISFSSPLFSLEKDVISMMSVKQRLERVEGFLGSDTLMDQAQQMEALREEISALREQIDQQSYELDTIKQRQRSLYLDMDRRLQNLETGSSSSGSPGSARRAPVAPPVAAGGSSRGGSPKGNIVGADKDGREMYNKAFGLLKEGQYKKSIGIFEKFLKRHPESKYSDNAQYWLGEANYAYRQYKQSLKEFQRLIAKYPDSTKIPGARLKVGYVYYELKNWSASRESLQQVVTLYPDTNVAKKAMERLERIKREGR